MCIVGENVMLCRVGELEGIICVHVEIPVEVMGTEERFVHNI